MKSPVQDETNDESLLVQGKMAQVNETSSKFAVSSKESPNISMPASLVNLSQSGSEAVIKTPSVSKSEGKADPKSVEQISSLPQLKNQLFVEEEQCEKSSGLCSVS